MEDNRQRYKAVCSECGHVFYACKSIAQEYFGILDAGHGSCPNCKVSLNLTFDEEAKEMKTKEFNKYLEERSIHKCCENGVLEKLEQIKENN